MRCCESPLFQRLSVAYGWFAKAGDILAIVILLFFRLNWGWQFFISGRGKLLDHASIVDFFTELHLPLPDYTAWFVAGVECVGGILLLLGLASRPVGLVLAINMVVAYFAVESDRDTIFKFFKDQDAFFQATPFFFLLTGLFAFAFGGGPVSLDALIAWWLGKQSGETVKE